jgi:hypothetical protein
MDKEKVTDATGHKTVHVNEMPNDRVRLSVNWDDLNPEPRRSENLDELESARKALIDEGFEVSEITRYYGRAYVTVLDD